MFIKREVPKSKEAIEEEINLSKKSAGWILSGAGGGAVLGLCIGLGLAAGAGTFSAFLATVFIPVLIGAVIGATIGLTAYFCIALFDYLSDQYEQHSKTNSPAEAHSCCR